MAIMYSPVQRFKCFPMNDNLSIEEEIIHSQKSQSGEKIDNFVEQQ